MRTDPRLSFAWARGATIIRNCPNWPEWIWEPCHPDEITAEGTQVRVHPKDDHLQYGPISSALREDAEACIAAMYDGYGKLIKFEVDDVYSDMAELFLKYFYEKAWITGVNSAHLCLMMLFAAEYLADEGL